MEKEEREKHILVIVSQPELQEADLHLRVPLLKQAAKAALGMDERVDIADMSTESRINYLTILGGARDTLKERTES